MAIRHLPQHTIRRIGASQVLTDPAAVVKELVDNALDAHATKINVEIHANTIDVIQVRDNGHGIPGGDDRQVVARRYCTSKITNENDLNGLGGSTLGFRGEALASAAAMSGSMTITTRTRSEQVAVALKVNQVGEVFATECTSLPVGTTVRVTDVFKGNPVRRQMAFKNTEKCLKRVRYLLQAYAFARPSVRISFKVLKAKHVRYDWTFAPATVGSIEDAAFKIVGAACASQCQHSIVEHAGFTVRAYIPVLDADCEKISNNSTFISVDGRPVSESKGTFKQLVKLFRETLRKADPRFNSVMNPFLCLDISCPRGSYDVNVEPSKDDVMFTDSSEVLAAAQHLFRMVYHGPNRNMTTSRAENTRREQPVSLSTSLACGTSLSAGPSPGSDLPSSVSTIQTIPVRPNIPLLNADHQEGQNRTDAVDSSDEQMIRQSWKARPNMYGCDEDDLDVLSSRPRTSHRETDLEELREARKDPHVTNPWILAKVNSSIRPPPLLQLDNHTSGSENAARHELRSPSMSSKKHHLSSSGPCEAGLLTPHNSSPSREQQFHYSDDVSGASIAGNRTIIGQVATLLQHVDAAQPLLDLGVVPYGINKRFSCQISPDFGHIAQHGNERAADGQPLEAIPAAPIRRSQHRNDAARANRPFVPPSRNIAALELTLCDHPQNDMQRSCQPKQRKKQTTSQIQDVYRHGEPKDGDDSACALISSKGSRDIRDFAERLSCSGPGSNTPECRNVCRTIEQQPQNSSESSSSTDGIMLDQSAVLSGAGFVPASEITALQAHVHARDAVDGGMASQKSSNSRPLQKAETDDVRAITRGKQPSCRRSSRKLSRIKSHILPLERTPVGSAVHNLEYLVKAAIGEVPEIVANGSQHHLFLSWNQEAVNTRDAFDLPFELPELQKLTDVLSELLAIRVSDAEMQQDLHELLSGAIKRHHETTAK